MEGFIFGQGTPMTYEQLQKQREIADALIMSNMETPRNVGEGLNAIGKALAFRSLKKKADKRDTELKGEFDAQFNSAFGGYGGGGPSVAQSGAPSGPATVFTPPDPSSPGAVAADTMAALGKQVFTPGDRESFIKAMMPHAIKVSQETGLDPRLVIAQAAQETGWGKSAPGNNFFGIKSHGKGGNSFATKEFIDGKWVTINDSFRGYSGMGESAADYARFLKENPRYRNMLAAGDLDSQIAALGESGYATDPNYANAIRSIATSIGLPEGFTPGAGGGAPAAPGMDLGTLASLASNPYATPGQRAVLEALIGQQTAAMDPMRNIELQKAQLELEQMQNPSQQAPEALVERQALLSAAGIDPQSPEGKQFLLTGQLPEAPKAPAPTDDMREYDLAKSQGYTGTFQQYMTEMKKAGAPNTTVSTTVGTEPSDGKLRGKLMEKEGEQWASYMESGTTSSGTVQDMQLLDELITMAPQGPITGRLAATFPGVNSAADAFQSVVKRVAPTLRAPGSGATSDIEYEGMLKSLPQLAAMPEANAAISAMVKAKAQINMERGQVVAAYQNGEISAADARSKINEINSRSIMTPELEAILKATGPAPDAPSESTPAPDGVEQDIWDAMTPEERALWD